jgi:predicted metal-dependent hydrolase
VNRREAIAAFAAEMLAESYYDAHEVLEEFWRTLDRRSSEALVLQGLIQGAVALEHLKRGHPDRAARLARKAVPKLDQAAEVDGFDATALRRRLIGMLDADSAQA